MFLPLVIKYKYNTNTTSTQFPILCHMSFWSFSNAKIIFTIHILLPTQGRNIFFLIASTVWTVINFFHLYVISVEFFYAYKNVSFTKLISHCLWWSASIFHSLFGISFHIQNKFYSNNKKFYFSKCCIIIIALCFGMSWIILVCSHLKMVLSLFYILLLSWSYDILCLMSTDQKIIK